MAKKSSKPTAVSGLAQEIGKKRPFRLIEREVSLNLARTFTVLSDQMQKIIKTYGLTPPQYNALRILRGHGTPVSVYQIGKEMIARQPDMPRLIDRLVSMGMAIKTRCESDRRVVWVTITSEARAVLKKLDGPLDTTHREQFKHMTVEQLQQLNDLLWLARNPDAELEPSK